jgi:hypothetical protein
MKNNDKPLYAQIYRNAITHHRNMIKFLCHLSREPGANKKNLLELAKSHAVEIKQILNNWELSFPKII